MTSHRTARLLRRALAALALACLAAAPARAGQWALDHFETTDQASYDRSGTAHTTTLPDALLYVQGNWLLEVSADGTSAAAWSGTTTAVFVWQPASPGDPPQDLHVLLDASAQAQAYGTGAAVQADDGLGDTAAAWAGDPQTPPLSGTYSGGLHLRTFAAGQAVTDGSGRVTMRVPVTQSSSATATPPLTYYDYNAYAYLYMQASTDSKNRVVSIDCPSIEPNYYKGADDTTGAGYQIPHPPDSFQADSVVSYNATDAEWTAGPYSFNGYASNFTDPTFSWSLSGAGSPSTTTQGFLNSPSTGSIGSGGAIGGIPVQLFFSSASFPQTSTVNLNVTDGPGTDGATGTGTYSVTWHEPYENWRDDPASPAKLAPTIILGTSAAPDSVNMGGSITADFTYSSFYTSALLQSGKIASEAGGEFVENPVWKTLLDTMGLAADQLNEQLAETTQSKVPVDSYSVWQDTVDNNPDNGSTFSPPPVMDGTETSSAVANEYHMAQVGKYIGYMAHFYLGDAYGSKGYIGDIHDQETYFPAGGDIHFVGDFVQNSGGADTQK